MAVSKLETTCNAARWVRINPSNQLLTPLQTGSERAHIDAAPHNLRDLSLNCMAKGKVLYEGHPVAAVMPDEPSTPEICDRPLYLIDGPEFQRH
jgi:hypothetical protein